ncbi:MAG TPA: heterodisulfide reductase-related iron-sulfur binding cluster [Acidimicrobiia bacterium]|jgi:glycerol-3-phosphate dehydrogenase subunit C|nr:heterodisulfide reductase-related iron-sulfur binding cluster [Acidimicrobiia bacterium]
MTAHLYDPLHANYFDPADARAERDRTFQICSDCRVCVKLCPSFKDLFRIIDTNHEDDVPAMNDREHRHVVDECYQCKLCFVVCPYTPEQGQEWVVDFPRLMLRSLAIQERAGEVPRSAKLLARTDLQGKVATALAPIVNTMTDVGFVRGLMEKTTGIAKDRLLPSFTKVRFSKWFHRHRPPVPGAAGDTVALFPTCLVEYQDPEIGKATVAVFERNGLACELPDGQVCCGMPWLDAGDVPKFEEHAKRNVAALVGAVKAGHDVVVPQPTCAYVLKNEYGDFLGTDDARLLAEHTFDVSEYLMARHKERPLDTDFGGTTYGAITWQAACHYRAQQMGPKSKQLMELTGAKVTMIERCAAIDGTWGLRAENVEMSKKIAKPLMEAVSKADAEVVAGDCHLANTAITEGTDRTPLHPMQVLARAYGVDGTGAEDA